ncbi:MAG: hypothetical protein Hyperionvirus30_6 [Hyperionvirus sp.]|uniref:Uncharacterized protein n=1 Tax=Hyperionvirus sp. TaxID=2487770 RepID=A0A3G5ABL9_9VIRU|nr:MAG: hypothetical protein Hyperionvirus30_6 [Hyperionvirus sp.]
MMMIVMKVQTKMEVRNVEDRDELVVPGNVRFHERGDHDRYPVPDLRQCLAAPDEDAVRVVQDEPADAKLAMLPVNSSPVRSVAVVAAENN